MVGRLELQRAMLVQDFTRATQLVFESVTYQGSGNQAYRYSWIPTDIEGSIPRECGKMTLSAPLAKSSGTLS